MHRFWWINFNHSFNNTSTETQAPGDTFLELITLSFFFFFPKHRKTKRKKFLIGSLNADLLCNVAYKTRKEPQGHEECGYNGYYLTSFDSDIWRQSYKNVFKHFSGCIPPLLYFSLTKKPCWKFPPWQWLPAQLRWEGAMRCGWGESQTVSKCKQRHSRLLSHICLCLRICLGVSYSHTFSPPKNIHRHAHSHINSSPTLSRHPNSCSLSVV